MNPIKNLFNSIPDDLLRSAILEIQTAESTGTYPNDSAVRTIARQVTTLTNQPHSSTLFMTEINLSKQAAFRWIATHPDPNQDSDLTGSF